MYLLIPVSTELEIQVNTPACLSLSQDLEILVMVGGGCVHALVFSGRAVPHDAGIAFWLQAVILQVQPLPVRGAVSTRIIQNAVKGHDVAQSHLQGFIFWKFLVLTPLRNHFAQLVESCIQALHPLPLSGVGCHPLPYHTLKLLEVSGITLRTHVHTGWCARLHLFYVQKWYYSPSVMEINIYFWRDV